MDLYYKLVQGIANHIGSHVTHLFRIEKRVPPKSPVLTFLTLFFNSMRKKQGIFTVCNQFVAYKSVFDVYEL